MHKVYYLRERDTAFFAGAHKFGQGKRGKTETVEVNLRGSEGDQGRKGGVLMRSRGKKQGDGDEVERLVEVFGYVGSGEQGEVQDH